jgi:hypothetical protein
MSGRQAGVELFRILALINAYQVHGLQTGRWFNARQPTWHWEYVIIVFCAIGITMLGLFQIWPSCAIRSPFRAKGLVFFCLTVVIYVRSLTWMWKWFGFQDLTRILQIRHPIVSPFSWFFTSHAELTLMTPVLNTGLLALSKRAYFVVDVGILVLLVWFGPTGYFIPHPGTNWENACMLYVFAGFFGVYGWPIGTVLTWLLFLVNFLFLRYCSVGDIFLRIPARWQWAFVNFRFGIIPGKNRVRHVAPHSANYLCPGNYVCGMLAVHAYRTMCFPSGISKTICFIGNKSFMLHLFDRLLTIFGNTAWNMLRYYERIRPPTMAILNLSLSTVQLLFLGIFLEIYRERIFVSAFELASLALRPCAFPLRLFRFLSIWVSHQGISKKQLRSQNNA